MFFLPVISFADIRQDSFPISAFIFEHVQGDCKDKNLALFFWFKSKGYSPKIKAGTKEGSGHLWLELDGIVYDATDWRFNGRPAKDLKDKLIEQHSS